MIYYQLFYSSVVNERPCQESPKFKASVHLSMVVKRREGITFSYFIGKHTRSLSNLCNNHILVKLRLTELKFSSETILIKFVVHTKFQLKIELFFPITYRKLLWPPQAHEKNESSLFELKLCVLYELDKNSF